MRKDLESRLATIEGERNDWISRLQTIDYLNGLDDYAVDEWEPVFNDDFITVIRSRVTGEVKGVYWDRRGDDEILSRGGNLEFL